MLLTCGLVALAFGDRSVAADPPFVGSIAYDAMDYQHFSAGGR